MSLYLYGAAVQGIQSFIFETNKLKEIVGASELVEQICSSLFKKFIDGNKVNVILSAAGNIKLSTSDKDDLKNIVLEFPKTVQEFAPGITISQALVKSIGDKLQKEDFDCLEEKLKKQRNIPIRPLEVTGCAIERARRTGKPAVSRDKDGKLVDLGIEKKSKKVTDSEGKNTDVHSRLAGKLLGKDGESYRKYNEKMYRFPFDMENIVHDECQWLAVIHADGNNLGKHIQRLEGDKPPENLYKQFSDGLESATRAAANKAFENVVWNRIISEEIGINKNYFPVRPIIIGGDDLAVICRADIALDFTVSYLQGFELETNRTFDDRKITACAGIAFIKESYPFHYAIHLAEELCATAKMKSKKVNPEDPPSSIAFHKVHLSYIDSYKEIKDNFLYARKSNVHFDYGPYAVNKDVDGIPVLEELTDRIKEIEDMEYDKKPSPKSGLRKWLSALHKDSGEAEQLLNRLNNIHRTSMEKLNLKEPISHDRKTIVFDVMSILSLKGGK